MGPGLGLDVEDEREVPETVEVCASRTEKFVWFTRPVALVLVLLLVVTVTLPVDPLVVVLQVPLAVSQEYR